MLFCLPPAPLSRAVSPDTPLLHELNLYLGPRLVGLLSIQSITHNVSLLLLLLLFLIIIIIFYFLLFSIFQFYL